MKILVNKKEIILLKQKLMNYINEIYDEIDYLEKLKDNLIWQSKSRNLVMNKYDENLIAMRRRIDVIKIYIKFLDAIVFGYEDALEEIKNEFIKLKGEMEWMKNL